MPDTPERLSVAVVSHLYPQKARAGYGVFVSEQVRALVDVGADVSTMIAPVPLVPWPLAQLSPGWRTYADAETERTDFDSVEVAFPRYISLPRKLLRGMSADSAVRAITGDPAVLSRLRRSDIILAHTALLDGGIARSLSLRLGIPYVVVVHGEDLYQNAARDARASLRRRVGEILGDAAGVLTVSGAAARGLHEAFPTLTAVTVLHNGVDTTLFAPASTSPDDRLGAAVARLGTPDRPLRVLTASHLVARKAQSYLLRAVAALVETGVSVNLTVAGDGPERDSLARLAGDLGISSRVQMIGAYRHEELVGLLRKSDLFALPSWDEAFGVVYLEALACGIPAIAANDGGAADILTEGADGYLVPTRDVEAIVRSMASFAALDPAARAQMQAAARATAEQFTWTANAESLAAYLRGIIDSSTAQVVKP